MSFSERSGLSPVRPIQRASMDGRLRNGLWNVVHALVEEETDFLNQFQQSAGREMLEWIWVDFRGAARDQLGHAGRTWLRDWFYAAKWYEVYDLIEFIAAIEGVGFTNDCNAALKRERAAYQIVQGKVVELTDEGQLKAIDEAMVAAEPFAPVHEHLRTAVARLGDRPEPDCRNAAKEAISAVETLAGMIAGSPGATLDAALKLIEQRKIIPLHPSLIKAWGAIYGYTSDAGIRHGLKEGQSSIELEDALYVVVSCSAFISYLIALAARAGVKVG